jgi:putative cell wall-binding protein
MTRPLLRNPITFWRGPLIAGVGSALLFAACASTPPEPTLEMKSAEQAIAAADKTRVADAASPELSEAREKLTAAQRAIQDERMVDAQRLARESRASAELASARIETAKARAVNDEIKSSTEVLAQEMQRNSTSGVK